MTVQKYDGAPVRVRIGELSTIELPPRIFRVRLTGLLFETDKTFLLPVAMHGIRGLVDYYKAHPELTAVVTGHTDRVGADAYNLGLSEERATSVAHFLKDEVDPWLACYQGSPHSKPWGTREDQHMLSAVKDGAGRPFYEGPVTGVLDAPTRDAVERYQTERGLTIDGQPGPQTRRALVTDYMKLDGTTLPASAVLEVLGCGENHNEVPTADGVDEPANRRVEIFLFDKVEPPNPGTCPGGGCAYPEWKKGALDTVDFDHDLCELLVVCHDEDLQPLDRALVRLYRDGAAVHELPTDTSGQAWFKNLLAGDYRVHGEKGGHRAQDRDVTVVSGGIAAPSQPAEKKSLLGDDTASDAAGSPSGSGNQPVKLQLDSELSVIHIVDEEPVGKLTDAVKEGAKNTYHAKWRGLEGEVQYPNEDPMPLNFDINGKAFPMSENQPGKLTWLGKHRPHVFPLRYRIRSEDGTTALVDPAVKAGETLKVRISSRVRLSILHFFLPFVSSTAANSLDTELLKLLDAAHVDDISIVSVVRFVNDPKNPRIDFTSEWWPMKKVDYLEKLIAACKPMGVQVVVGWGAVDAGKAIQHKELVDFLAGATEAQIITLANNIASFFFDTHKLDIGGFMFDFELNGLGPPQKQPEDQESRDKVAARVAIQTRNVALLYRSTAEAIRTKKGDAFVSYCNAAFKQDNEEVVGFMRIQQFDILDGCPNLVARPMCFFVDTIPADDIRASVKYATGKGVEPAQLQYALYQSQLETKGEWDSLLTNTFAANRIGVALYQFPGVAAEKPKDPDSVKKAQKESRALQVTFLENIVKWNETLNKGEAVPTNPPVPGQPLQVPHGPAGG